MNIKEQQLGGGMTVFTSEIHTFGTDGVLLQALPTQKRTQKRWSLVPDAVLFRLFGAGTIDAR